jgi:polysaccharide deacetylase family protein (PEP-CTERM system associated)
LKEPVNAFTVDVEDYFHVSNFRRHISCNDWENFESRVARNTHRILELLDRHDVKATFFVLGWVADRYPRLIQEIRACGHECGCHSYWHQLVYGQSPDEFRQDLRRCRDVLQDTIGTRVTAYRAPSFSITKESLWALEILVEEGFRIDSSIFPIRRRLYGIPEADITPHQIDTPSGALWECPPSVMQFVRFRIPVSGGGYFRLYPFPFTCWCLSQINGRRKSPVVFYMHPWELDAQQPRISTASRISKAKHYVNLALTEKRLEGLLSGCASCPAPCARYSGADPPRLARFMGRNRKNAFSSGFRFGPISELVVQAGATPAGAPSTTTVRRCTLNDERDRKDDNKKSLEVRLGDPR